MSGSAVLEDPKLNQDSNQDHLVDENSGVASSLLDGIQRELQEFKEWDIQQSETVIDGMRTKYIRSYEQLYRVIEMLQDGSDLDVRLKYPKSKTFHHKELESFVNELQDLSVGEMLEKVDAKVREQGLRSELSQVYDLQSDDVRELDLTELHDLRKMGPRQFSWLEKATGRLESAHAQGRHIAIWVGNDNAAEICDCLGKALDKIAAVDNQKVLPLLASTVQVWQGDVQAQGGYPEIKSLGEYREALTSPKSQIAQVEAPVAAPQPAPSSGEAQVDTLVALKEQTKVVKPRIEIETRVPEEVLARYNVKPALVTEIFTSERGGQVVDAYGNRYFLSLRDHSQHTLDDNGQDINVNGNADRIPRAKKDSVVLISNDTPTRARPDQPQGKRLPDVRRYFVEEDLLNRIASANGSPKTNGAAAKEPSRNGSAQPAPTRNGTPAKKIEVQKQPVEPVKREVERQIVESALSFDEIVRPWEQDDFEGLIRSAFENSTEVEEQRTFAERLEVELVGLNDEHCRHRDAELATLEQSFKAQRLETEAQLSAINREIEEETAASAESGEKDRLAQLQEQRKALVERTKAIKNTKDEVTNEKKEFFKSEWMEQFAPRYELLHKLKEEYVPAE